MKKLLSIALSTTMVILLSGCFGSKMASSAGGEVTGVSGRVAK